MTEHQVQHQIDVEQLDVTLTGEGDKVSLVIRCIGDASAAQSLYSLLDAQIRIGQIALTLAPQKHRMN